MWHLLAGWFWGPILRADAGNFLGNAESDCGQLGTKVFSGPPSRLYPLAVVSLGVVVVADPAGGTVDGGVTDGGLVAVAI
jgi:hypothetical protein